MEISCSYAGQNAHLNSRAEYKNHNINEYQLGQHSGEGAVLAVWPGLLLKASDSKGEIEWMGGTVYQKNKEVRKNTLQTSARPELGWADRGVRVCSKMDPGNGQEWPLSQSHCYVSRCCRFYHHSIVVIIAMGITVQYRTGARLWCESGPCLHPC